MKKKAAAALVAVSLFAAGWWFIDDKHCVPADKARPYLPFTCS